MSSTYAAERVQLLQELDAGFQIPNANVDAFAAGSVTSSSFLRDTNKAPSFYSSKNTVIFRPTSATAADNIRYAGLLTNSTGLLAHTGANYADTTVGTETVELWHYGIRPDTDVLNAFNRAQGDIYFHTWEPFAPLVPDAAMRESGVTSWGTPSTPAIAAKQTTRVFPGFIRALTVTCSAANDYIPTANINVTPHEPLTVIALGRLNSGTSSQMGVRDVTGGTTIDTVSHSESTWQFSVSRTTAPAGCHNISVRLGGTGASDVVDWQALWVYRPQSSQIGSITNAAATYVDEIFKVEALAYTTLGLATAANATGQVYQAMAMDPVEISADDYSPDVMATSPNPSLIQFHRGCEGYFQYPLWMQLRLPYSERGTVSAETDVVYAPRHLLMPAWKRRLLESPSKQQTLPNGAQIYAQALAAVEAHSRARALKGPAQRRPTFRYPSLTR